MTVTIQVLVQGTGRKKVIEPHERQGGSQTGIIPLLSLPHHINRRVVFGLEKPESEIATLGTQWIKKR